MDTYSGIVYSQEVDADATGRTEWDVRGLGIKAVYSKKLTLITPFVGVAIHQNTGDVETSFAIDGDVSLSVSGISETEDFEEKVIYSNSIQKTQPLVGLI